MPSPRTKVSSPFAKKNRPRPEYLPKELCFQLGWTTWLQIVRKLGANQSAGTCTAKNFVCQRYICAHASDEQARYLVLYYYASVSMPVICMHIPLNIFLLSRQSRAVEASTCQVRICKHERFSSLCHCQTRGEI